LGVSVVRWHGHFLLAKRIELFDALAAQFCLSLIQLHDEQLGCADLESGILQLLNILESGTTARDNFPSPSNYSQQRAPTFIALDPVGDGVAACCGYMRSKR
jgi:hypothetical protein